ncbi:undecaprenyl-diphosphate phosphatase [Natronogracilivirga saccharolytica]|uniref:Undecaprenyl-diphosphatase n=1 Tax=Natronogracilivirga saccharolytica TaxID=2812953 RepID=A0A8J7RKG5_9BACT|nr:undecaprenyl-diphosphate phosphatase [Natronogracilivirga saccharolytica]MBP3191314.1 undecaprenyl-diphosphate phosphatase [Natronogracilivirga saccharolytica]
MDIIQAILLGLLQGITEFLPVSSSGHLALGRALLGRDLEPGITFEIVVHFGSFCSIVVYFRKKIWEILTDIFKSFSPSGIRSKRFISDGNTQLSYIILLSMIPAGLVGFTMKENIEAIFLNPFFVSCMLLVTGTLLFSTKFVGNPEKDVDVKRGILVGVAQAFAILPGISRSGSTISVSLFSGMSRQKAANFSFLMVLPVLAGAMLLEMIEIAETGIEMTAVISLFAGYLTSFVSGYFALKYLIILLKKEKFHYFAYYCWTVGIVGIFYFF